MNAYKGLSAAALRVSVPAAVTYRCEVVMDSWPSSFIKVYTLTLELASSVA